tara:strand:- start:85 stop:267 length:183 start_codon:yes stop_codon:yes gene_type:complete
MESATSRAGQVSCAARTFEVDIVVVRSLEQRPPFLGRHLDLLAVLDEREANLRALPALLS